MEKIRIKCPVCGAILEVLNNPAYAEKNVVCPNCKEKRKFKEFKKVVPKAPVQVDDTTEINLNSGATGSTKKKQEDPGYLMDKKTMKRYDLKEGKFTIGRKPSKSAPKADIPIETEDQGMSRVHMNVRVTLARDGYYHVYVSNAANKNPSYVNGVQLQDGDEVGLKHGDILKLCDSEFVYVGMVVDDKTELTR